MISTPHGYRWTLGTYDEQGRQHMLMGKDGKPFTVPYDKDTEYEIKGRTVGRDAYNRLKQRVMPPESTSDEPGGA